MENVNEFETDDEAAADSAYEAQIAAEMVRKDFRVLDAKLAWFKAQMAKLAKRAARLGVEAPGYTVGEPIDELVTKRIAGIDDEEAAHLTGAQSTIEVVERSWPVTVTGKAPKFAGWTLAATLQHLEGGETLIRSIAKDDAPAKYRTAKSDCEHCQTYRRRNDTFLVRHDDGTWKQVGRQCIRDFLGHKSPENIARMAEYLAEAMGYGEEGGFGGGRAAETAGILSFLSTTATSIRAKGWLSRSKARELDEQGQGGKAATANHVLAMMFPPKSPTRDEKRELAEFWASAKPADGELAQAALDWALALGDDGSELNDYLHNCRAIARLGSVEHRTAGYAASIITAYDKELRRKQEQVARPESNHVGTVGERIRMQLTVRAVRHTESDFGVSHLYIMSDAAGNDVKWFASSEAFDEGQTYDVMATVKKHDEYKGRKCTLVSRCALYVEKPKKNKANKAVAQGVCDFVQGLMAPYQIAEGLCAFVRQLVSAYDRYHDAVARGIEGFCWAWQHHHNAVAYGLQHFVEAAREWYPERTKRGAHGVCCMLVEMLYRTQEEAAVVGDAIVNFFRAGTLGYCPNDAAYPGESRNYNRYRMHRSYGTWYLSEVRYYYPGNTDGRTY